MGFAAASRRSRKHSRLRLGKKTRRAASQRESFSLLKQTIGVEAPDTINATVNLASSLKTTRHVQEARQLLEEMLRLRKVHWFRRRVVNTIKMAVLLGTYSKFVRCSRWQHAGYGHRYLFAPFAI